MAGDEGFLRGDLLAERCVGNLNDDLLSPTFLRKLERLSLNVRRPMRGQVLGSRRSVRHGASVEFSDYREYTAGDDLRYVDWKAYGRLERLFVKLFHEEDDLLFHLILDSSQSMAFGSPITKLRFAQELCAALGVVALSEFDRCYLTSLPGNSERHGQVLRGRVSIPTLLSRIVSLRGSGEAMLADALRSYAGRRASPGVMLIVSDFYDHQLSRAHLARIARHTDIMLVQVVSPEELDPAKMLDLAGDLRLIDSESNRSVELTVTPAMIEQYRVEFRQFSDNLELLARSVGANYLQVATDISVEDIVLDSLRKRRLVA